MGTIGMETTPSMSTIDLQLNPIAYFTIWWLVVLGYTVTTQWMMNPFSLTNKKAMLFPMAKITCVSLGREQVIQIIILKFVFADVFGEDFHALSRELVPLWVQMCL